MYVWAVKTACMAVFSYECVIPSTCCCHHAATYYTSPPTLHPTHITPHPHYTPPSQIYPTLFCRVHEPSYIKRIKLEILATIADESNAYDIVTELTECVSDIDTHLAREAVNAVGQIALKVPGVAGIVERLLGFLEVGKEHITAETLIQMKDLLRRYPDISEVCISSLGAINPSVCCQGIGMGVYQPWCAVLWDGGVSTLVWGVVGLGCIIHWCGVLCGGNGVNA